MFAVASNYMLSLFYQKYCTNVLSENLIRQCC